MISRVVLLGIVQGLTEFLPVSSSGHLVVFQRLLSMEVPGVTLEIALHLGTLLAVFAVYGEDFCRAIWRFVAISIGVFGGRRRLSELGSDPASREALLLAVGTAPAGVAGLALKDLFESAFNSPLTVVGGFVITGVLLWLSAPARESPEAEEVALRDVISLGAAIPYGERRRASRSRRRRPRPSPDPLYRGGTRRRRRFTAETSFSNASVWQALFIGLGQALAITPGISRSGATVSAALRCGLPPDLAARFSFMLSIPAILGAAVTDLIPAVVNGAFGIASPGAAGVVAVPNASPMGASQLLLGAAVAAVAGIVAIRVFISSLAKGGMRVFAVYCWSLAVLTYLFLC